MPQRTVKERARRKSMVTPRPEHAPFEDRLPGCHSQRDFWRSLDGFSSGDWSLENVPRDSRNAPTRTLLGHSLRRSLLYCVQRFPERTGSALDAARIPFPPKPLPSSASAQDQRVSLLHPQQDHLLRFATSSFANEYAQSRCATIKNGRVHFLTGQPMELAFSEPKRPCCGLSAGLSHRSVIAVKRSSGTREGRASVRSSLAHCGLD